jgi:hypothetical protein
MFNNNKSSSYVMFTVHYNVYEVVYTDTGSEVLVTESSIDCTFNAVSTYLKQLTYEWVGWDKKGPKPYVTRALLHVCPRCGRRDVLRPSNNLREDICDACHNEEEEDEAQAEDAAAYAYER